MLRSPIEMYPRVRTTDFQPTPAVVLAHRARWFALVAAAVWLYAAWAPWIMRIPLIGPCYPMACDPPPFEDIASYPNVLSDPIALGSSVPSGLGWMLAPPLWGALTPLGLLIAICLWSRVLGTAARIVYALWLIAMGSMATTVMRAWLAIVYGSDASNPSFQLQAGVGFLAVLLTLGLLINLFVNVVMYYVRRVQQRRAAQAGSVESARVKPPQVERIASGRPAPGGWWVP